MSLCARGKWAISRRLDAARLRRSFRAARHGDRKPTLADAGFGLVEVVVSLALLAIVIVPVTRIIIGTENASDSLHLRAEAADLATQALETAQYQTANGVDPTPGITTTTQYSGTDPFTVAVDYELVTGTGADSTICIGAAGQPSSRIWTVKATVTWGKGNLKGQLVETTLISPALADLADTNAAEIAVPVYNADDSTLETTSAVNITVTGSCAGSQCSGETVPSNEHTTESGNTGSTGCAVFTDLFAGSGWTYNITASPASGWVDPNELFYMPAASGLQIWTGVSVEPNQVTVVSNPNLIVAQGATMTVKFQTVNFGTVTPPTVDSSVSPAPYLPVTVQSSTLLCSTLEPNTCVIGNGTSTEGFSSSASAPQTAQLFPGPAVTGSTPNYSAWAGDQSDSEPSDSGFYGTTTPTSFQAVSGGSGTLTLPVYPLTLTITLGSGHGTLSGMSVLDTGGGDTMTLNGTSGTVATGLPLGEFQLETTGTGNVTPASGSDTYFWMTPTGVCGSTTVMTSPCSSPSTSAIAVTIG